MGDLHGGARRRGVPVVDQEPIVTKASTAACMVTVSTSRVINSEAGHDSAGLGVPADRDQPQEQLSGGLLLLEISRS